MSKKSKKVAKVELKKKPKPVAQPMLDSIPGNINKTPRLAEDDKNKIEIFPPDPLTEFSRKELDSSNPKSAFWELRALANKRFPLLGLVLTVKDTREITSMAFYDERYKCTSVPMGGISPPTWIDPEVFVRLALKNEQIVKLLQSIVKDNSFKKLPELLKLLDNVLQTDYVEYLKTQFTKTRELLGRWLIARQVWESEKQ